jgi:hypothetical protein
MNIEKSMRRSDTYTARGVAYGPGTLAKAIESLEQVKEQLLKIAEANSALLHSAEFTWAYDAGYCCAVGRGKVTCEITTSTREDQP